MLKADLSPTLEGKEIDYLVRKGRPCGIRRLPTILKDVLRQALLWQLGHFVPYEAIEELLWGGDSEGGPLGAHFVILQLVYRLRQDGCVIETWRGIGVRMRSSG